MPFSKAGVQLHLLLTFGGNDLCCLNGTAEIAAVKSMEHRLVQTPGNKACLLNTALGQRTIQLAHFSTLRVPLGFAMSNCDQFHLMSRPGLEPITRMSASVEVPRSLAEGLGWRARSRRRHRRIA